MIINVGVKHHLDFVIIIHTDYEFHHVLKEYKDEL